ncbi:MAG: DUF6788 family protein [Mycobacteriales bacterium]
MVDQRQRPEQHALQPVASRTRHTRFLLGVDTLGHRKRTVTRDRQRARNRAAAELARIRHLLPGTVTVRLGPCGNANCRCHADPPQLYGPYISWTRKVEGKTVTRLLTDEQWADYRSWFDNARRIRQLIADLEVLSLQELETDPRIRQK